MRLAEKKLYHSSETYTSQLDTIANRRNGDTIVQRELNLIHYPIGSKYLFEELCTEKRLLEGWREVRKNRGTSGIDGQTIESFKSRLQEEIKRLKQELENWKYEPQRTQRPPSSQRTPCEYSRPLEDFSQIGSISRTFISSVFLGVLCVLGGFPCFSHEVIHA